MTTAREDLSRLVLAWYDCSRRRLPWRAPPGSTAEPYHVWLSEIMLQQTTVVTVIPYFHAFLKRWPSVADLARADMDAVLHAWQGLGYYARARNLHACARTVAGELDGRFPEDEEGLRRLPGIGAYTAAAIAAIAFGRKATPVDGNVLRVTARMFAVDAPLPAARKSLERLAASLTPERRTGDFAQAVMDLGATVCTPRRPACGHCPWSAACAARAEGRPEVYPLRAPKKEKPRRHGVVFRAVRGDGAVLLRRRPERGLLGGMMEFPSTAWRDAPWTVAEARAEAPLKAPWRRLPGVVRHTFTHFHLELTVLSAPVADHAQADGIWCPPDGFSAYALPTVMKKVVSLVDS